jgi:hypothetical protein
MRETDQNFGGAGDRNAMTTPTRDEVRTYLKETWGVQFITDELIDDAIAGGGPFRCPSQEIVTADFMERQKSPIARAKQFLQHNPNLRAVLDLDFDAWTPRGHAAAEAIVQFAEELTL